MKGFKTTIIIWAMLSIVTGVLDLIVGISAWQNIGMALSTEGFSDSILDSQVRFLGVVWIGYGVLLVISVLDLQRYTKILSGALFIVFVGGLARVVSIFQTGMPDSETGRGFVVFALVIELLLMPLLLLWQQRVMKNYP